ncbi:MAG: DUF3800 domain-containing protein [Brevundimonas sp.]|uniref:DUF3800 domain-containing protein n=1 Tax=Brevundimonas sp. TaxID=1871086 RepID=UPI00271C6B01|nr:DUF3800 domain-containing protein [Brevundimonas sp.]MDO9588812.1 DUF3800 domain-containing protein [Brevundimonas sp.]
MDRPFSDYLIFADESGDHGLATFEMSYPVFVLAFVLVRKDHYVSSIVPAIQQLKLDFFGHDQAILHERDIRRQSPPFGFLRKDASVRAAFLERLNAVVAGADFEIISTAIHKDRLKRRYALPWNPYDIALLFCMEKAMERLVALRQVDRTQHVVFESRGGPEDANLELSFRRIAANAGGWGVKQTDFSGCNWEPVMAPKSCNSSGLQLADLVARPIGLRSLRPLQTNRAFDVLGPKLKLLKSFP